MKKISIILSAAVSILALAGCQKENIAPAAENSGSTFDVIANIQDTKTTLEGKKVEWAEGDKISIAIDDPAATEWKTGQTFTYKDGKFTCSSKIADGNYAFRALYAPDQLTYNKNTGTTYKLAAEQNQDCSKPTAHIGQHDALAGWFKATTPVTSAVKIDMSHLCALMEVDVVNNTGADMTVSSLTITADENIAGLYNVDYDADPIAIAFKETDPNNASFKPSGSKSITVNVTGGSVAKGASLPVYFVMAPKSKYSGNITLTVKDNVGEKKYEKKVAVSNVDFAAGTLNKTNYTLTDGVAMNFKTLAEVHALAAEVTDGSLNVKDATIIALGKSTCAVKDATGMMFVYVAAPEGFAIGDKVNLWGCNTSSYGDTPKAYRQITSPTFEKVGKDEGYVAPTPTVLDAAGMDALNGAFEYGKYCQFDAKLTINGNYYNCTMDGSSAKPSIIAPESGITVETGKSYTFSGYALYMKSGYLYFIVTKAAECKAEDLINAMTEKVMGVGKTWEIGATAASGLTVSYASDNDAVATVDAGGKVTSKTEGVANITMTTPGNDKYKPGKLVCKVTVSAGAAETKYYVKVTADQEDWSGTYLLVAEGTKTNGNVALSSFTTFGSASKVIVAGGKIESSEAVDAWQVVIAKNAKGYTMKFGSKYMNWTSGNTLDLQASESDNTTWTLAWHDKNFATIRNVKDNARYLIWNDNSPRFACYTGKVSATGMATNYIAPSLYKLQ